MGVYDSQRVSGNAVYDAQQYEAVSGSQTLSPGLFANANTFYAPIVSVGPVTLTQSARFDNTNTFYLPIVSLAGGSQSLAQSSRFDNSNIFYSPTVGGAGVTLSPADIAAIADAVWSKAIEGFKADEMMRVMFAALAGKREGLGTSVEQYMAVDGVTPRITFTPDANGNGMPVVDGTP